MYKETEIIKECSVELSIKVAHFKKNKKIPGPKDILDDAVATVDTDF
jgi:hypothetical protein